MFLVASYIRSRRVVCRWPPTIQVASVVATSDWIHFGLVPKMFLWSYLFDVKRPNQLCVICDAEQIDTIINYCSPVVHTHQPTEHHRTPTP